MGADTVTDTRRQAVALFIRTFSRYGGVEIFCYRFWRFLQSNGIPVRVVCGENRSGIEHPDILETGLLRPGRSLKLLSFYIRAGRYRQKLPDDTVTVALGKVAGCHIYRTGGGSHIDFMLQSLKGYRGYLRKGGKAVSRAARPVNWLAPYLEKKIYTHPRTRHYIAISHLVAEEIQQRFGLETQKVVTINNGVDTSKFNPAERKKRRNRVRESFSLPPDAVVIGYCATNFELKGLGHLIGALQRLPQRHCILVAGGRNPQRYQKLAATLGVGERVRFLGRVSDMADFYAGVDVFCHPSFYDTFGSVVSEALSMGVAVVVSPYTGAKDIVREGVNGYTLGTVSEQAIAQVIPKAVGLSGGFDARMIPSDDDIFNRYLDVIADIRRRLGYDTGNGI
jgi:UDP-glucose:(heptosyl)LPS alpha-1,3-glucosyltransferase